MHPPKVMVKPKGEIQYQFPCFHSFSRVTMCVCTCVSAGRWLIVKAMCLSLSCDSDSCHVECFLQQHSDRRTSREDFAPHLIMNGEKY